MIQIIKDLIEGYKERVRNPIISSLLISFSIYNWRPISILLFSDKIIEERIDLIENNYLTSDVICKPILLALAYTIIMPYINVSAQWIILKANEIQNSRNNRKRLFSLNHKIEEAKLERKIAEEIAGRKETEELTKTIDELTSLLDIKSNELNNLMSSNSMMSKENNDKIKMLNDEITFLKNSLNNVERENQYIREVHSLLIDFSKTSERKIKLFLKSNISDIELINLKKHSKATALPITDLGLNDNNISLMLKAKILRKPENSEAYTVTDIGKRFIEEL